MKPVPLHTASLLLDGQRWECPPGFPRVYHGAAGRLGTEDFRPRQPGTWVRSICLHTRWGVAPILSPEPAPIDAPDWVLQYGSRCRADSTRKAGAHFSVGATGNIAQHLDPVPYAAHHAGPVNEVSIGVELYQDRRGGTIYEATLQSAVTLIDELTYALRIQRQIFIWPERNRRFGPPLGGRDFVGVFGHRNVPKSNRGRGDPGDLIFERLARAGYPPEDRSFWSDYQRARGLAPDGIPGPRTVAYLEREGHPRGLLVPRPSDRLPRDP